MLACLPGLYAQWQADRSLTPEQHAAGLADYSDEYLADRAAFLTWKNKMALLDKAAAAPFTETPDAWFRNYVTNRTLHLGATLTDAANKPRHVFGADQADKSQSPRYGGYAAANDNAWRISA